MELKYCISAKERVSYTYFAVSNSIRGATQIHDDSLLPERAAPSSRKKKIYNRLNHIIIKNNNGRYIVSVEYKSINK